jgi:DNA-directed RNA polymerase specialized sigma24 family protein
VRRTTARCAFDACRKTFGWRQRHRTTGKEATQRLRNASNEDRRVPHARHPWCGLDDPADAAVASEDLGRLEAVVARLSAEERVTYQVLCREIKHREAARRSGVHLGTVYTWCDDLTAKLRAELGEQPRPARPAKRRRRAK